MSAELTIVVVTYNSAHVVTDLLDSLPAALDGVSADTVIVDNGSTDDTVRVVEARGDCRVIRSENRGYSAGINTGVRSSRRTPAVLVLNPDARLDPHFVAPMLEALAQPATGIVSPRVHNADGTLHHSLRREPSLRRTLGLTGTGLAAFAEYMNRSEEYLHAQVVDWAMGAILLVARDCYDAVGGWDESYFLYSEETDFCLRARDLGFLTRYEPRAVAVHIGGGSGQSARTHSMQIVNRVRLYRRRHGQVAASAYLLLTALREAVWIRRGGERHRVAISALFRPSRRPAELGCSDHLIPR